MQLSYTLKKIQYRVIRKVKDAGLYIFFIFFILFYTRNPLQLLSDLLLKRPLIYRLKSGYIFETGICDIRAALALHEIYVQRVYTKTLEIGADDTVVDIGATFGDFSLLAAGKTSGRVIACEPIPENIRLLKRNIRANRIKNIQVEAVAIGRRGKRRKLFLSSTTEQHSFYNRDININWDKKIFVPSLTLVELMHKYHIKQIDFLKLDCEGAEGEIFYSTPQIYLKRMGKIVMEYHNTVSRLSHIQIARILEKAGFAVWIDGKSGYPYGYISAQNKFLNKS